MKQKIRKGLLYLAFGFVALFSLRLLYGYIATSEASIINAVQETAGLNQIEFSRKNYASEKLKVERESGGKEYSVDQKYEKVASLSSKTSSFDEDEKKIRDLTTRYNAIIQFEQNTGMKGDRRLNLAIGVPPEKFDIMVGEIKAIGSLLSIRIDKTDKTNEYKDLQAKRISIEKARDALLNLKGKGGSIAESINLEKEILAVESEIQSMGVRLGEYDQENEFCTVKFGLEEQKSVAMGRISPLQRIKVALEWTIKYYTLLVVLLFTGSLFVMI